MSVKGKAGTQKTKATEEEKSREVTSGNSQKREKNDMISC